MIHFYPKQWHVFTSRQSAWLNEKWFDSHGLTFDPDVKPISYDDEARVVTFGKNEVPVRTPPLWVSKREGRIE